MVTRLNPAKVTLYYDSKNQALVSKVIINIEQNRAKTSFSGVLSWRLGGGYIPYIALQFLFGGICSIYSTVLSMIGKNRR